MVLRALGVLCVVSHAVSGQDPRIGLPYRPLEEVVGLRAGGGSLVTTWELDGGRGSNRTWLARLTDLAASRGRHLPSSAAPPGPESGLYLTRLAFLGTVASEEESLALAMKILGYKSVGPWTVDFVRRQHYLDEWYTGDAAYWDSMSPGIFKRLHFNTGFVGFPWNLLHWRLGALYGKNASAGGQGRSHEERVGLVMAVRPCREEAELSVAWENLKHAGLPPSLAWNRDHCRRTYLRCHVRNLDLFRFLQTAVADDSRSSPAVLVLPMASARSEVNWRDLVAFAFGGGPAVYSKPPFAELPRAAQVLAHRYTQLPWTRHRINRHLEGVVRDRAKQFCVDEDFIEVAVEGEVLSKLPPAPLPSRCSKRKLTTAQRLECDYLNALLFNNSKIGPLTRHVNDNSPRPLHAATRGGSNMSDKDTGRRRERGSRKKKVEAGGGGGSGLLEQLASLMLMGP